MEEIYVDRENMDRRLRDVVSRVDGLDASLEELPPSVDAGVASAHIAFIAGAAAEAANEYAGAVRLLAAVTADVLHDLNATDQAMSAEISAIDRQLDD